MKPPEYALTLEQYRQLDLSRPLTDAPFGVASSSRRAQSAELSALHSNHDYLPARPGRPNVGVNDGARCGTDSGHRTHYRLGEQPCDQCRAAHRDAARLRKANRRSAA